ncbi:MAG: methyltransferase domain-containing protein [Anaerolineae bacterium]|nr:methyltransferase domain-containing protein [Anaerolineae bacterium]
MAPDTTPDAKSLSQQQFGAHAASYVTSATHSKGYSLDRLVEFVQPADQTRPNQCALDIATGGGHTALALARHGAWIVAGDLTHPMLLAARDHIAAALADQNPAGIVRYAQFDAERLPFPADTFAAVTCRIAPHHFPQVAEFVRECARVCAPGGVVAVVDQLSPGDPQAARYVNAFERLRDPSHGWAYNEVEWQGFFKGAGLDIQHFEAFDTHHDLTPWAERMGNDAATITRLRAMLIQAPAPVAAWMQPTFAADARFVIRQFLLVGRK